MIVLPVVVVVLGGVLALGGGYRDCCGRRVKLFDNKTYMGQKYPQV